MGVKHFVLEWSSKGARNSRKRDNQIRIWSYAYERQQLIWSNSYDIQQLILWSYAYVMQQFIWSYAYGDSAIYFEELCTGVASTDLELCSEDAATD